MVTSTQPHSDHEQPRAAKRARFWLLSSIVAISIMAILLAGVAGYLWMRSNGGSDEVASGIPAIGGPFALLNAEGKQGTHRHFLGTHIPIHFRHSFCPHVCPTTLANN